MTFLMVNKSFNRSKLDFAHAANVQVIVTVLAFVSFDLINMAFEAVKIAQVLRI